MKQFTEDINASLIQCSGDDNTGKIQVLDFIVEKFLEEKETKKEGDVPMDNALNTINELNKSLPLKQSNSLNLSITIDAPNELNTSLP